MIMVKSMDATKRNKRSFGNVGESIAVDYLRKNNYSILVRNYRVGRLGEIDIIARDGEYICFIEVKTRSSTIFGMPSEAVNFRKQENIRMLASIYLSNFKLHDNNIRFDIVEIIGTKNSTGSFNASSINLIRNAF